MADGGRHLLKVQDRGSNPKAAFHHDQWAIKANVSDQMCLDKHNDSPLGDERNGAGRDGARRCVRTDQNNPLPAVDDQNSQCVCNIILPSV